MAAAAHTPSSAPPLAPSLAGDRWLEPLRNFRKRRLGFLMETLLVHREIARFRVGPIMANIVLHPEGVRHLLQENPKNYDKQTRGFNNLRPLLGNGLLTSDGEFWLRQRRIAQPAFHKNQIAGFADTMVRAAVELADRWEPLARQGGSIDVRRAMMRITLRIVGETLLSTDVTGDADEVGQALSQLLVDANRRMSATFSAPLHWPTPRNVRSRRAAAVLDGVVGRIIAERRGGARKKDLLTTLMDARDGDAAPGTFAGMTDTQLRDEVMTIFLAGHETTANALTWTFYSLSKHPSVHRTLLEELDGALGERPPALEDMARLPFCQMIIKEALRLYPPVWLASRRAVGDDVLCGCRVRAGELVFFSPYATQRHPDFWDNPEGFDPTRFTPEQESKRAKFTYFPFGGGPRVCIGNGFAMLEATLVLATLAQRFRLELVPGTHIEPEPVITLRPNGAVPMTVHRR